LQCLLRHFKEEQSSGGLIEALIIGGADEGLNVVTKLHGMISADVRVERAHVPEDLDQLEMIGSRVPGDQSEIAYSWIIPTVSDELFEQWFRLIDEVGYNVDVCNDHDLPKIVASGLGARQEYYDTQC
jgi:hypothetical protein